MTATSSGNSGTDPNFPHAPAGWSQNEAARAAAAEGLEPDESRWEAVRALQDYYSRHDELAINTRDLHDALGGKVSRQGRHEIPVPPVSGWPGDPGLPDRRP